MSTDLVTGIGGAALEGPNARYYGKYRATVVGNVDPLQIGRIQVYVPGVSSLLPSTWAMPCVPVTGASSGVFVLPAVGAGVWIEFEQGDPDYPIWVGGFWGSSSEVPSAAKSGMPASPSTVLQSGAGHSIVISDLAGPGGGIALTVASGAKIAINDTGIVLDTGKGAKIELGSATVKVNNGALEVK